MKVGEIMQKEKICLRRGMLWHEAAKILVENNVSGAPVLDENENIIGIVSEKDLFRAIYPAYKDFYESPESHLDFSELEEEAKSVGSKKVEEFMSSRLITADPETPVLKIGALMVATGVHRVPVLEGGKLVGMVGRRDIYKAILKERFDF